MADKVRLGLFSCNISGFSILIEVIMENDQKLLLFVKKVAMVIVR